MNNRQALVHILPFVLILGFLLSACAPVTPAEPAEVETEEEVVESEAEPVETEAETVEAEPMKIRLSSLNTPEVLPAYIAEQEGIFDNYGIDFELIISQSGTERNQILESGQADVMTSVPLEAMLLNQDEVRYKIVYKNHEADENSGFTFIIGAAGSGIESLEDLRGQEIAMSTGSVTEFAVDTILAEAGVSDDEFTPLVVMRIPERMTLLQEGKVTAGAVPRTIGILLEREGAKLLGSDRNRPDISNNSLLVRVSFLEEHPETVKAFVAAWKDAQDLYNQDPEAFRALAVDKGILAPPVKDLPDIMSARYPVGEVTSVEQWNSVMQWLLAKGYLDQEIPYESVVTEEFLP